MVEISDIVDDNSLEEWVRKRAVVVSALIATRAALRTLPALWDWSISARPHEADLVLLFVLRSLLSASVGAAMPDDSLVRAATRVAAAAARSAADYSTVLSGSHDAMLAARAAYGAGTRVAADNAGIVATDAAQASANSQRFWEAVRLDCAVPTIDMLSQPLWPERADLMGWAELKRKVAETNETKPSIDWLFWVQWYDALMQGKVRSDRKWEMLKEIALIDNEYWEKGPAHVNPMIDQIVDRYALEATQFGENLTFNGQSERLAMEPASNATTNKDQCVAKLREIDELLEQFDNYKGVVRAEVFLVRRGIDHHPDNAVLLHLNVRAARQILSAYVANGNCPSFESEPVLGLFDTTLQEVELRLEQERDVQEASQFRFGADSLLNDSDAMEAMLDAADEIAGLSEGRLATELNEDARIAADISQPTELRRVSAEAVASRSLRVRIVSRYQVFRTALDETEAVTTKTAKIIGGVGTVGAVGWGGWYTLANSPKIAEFVAKVTAVVF